MVKQSQTKAYPLVLGFKCIFLSFYACARHHHCTLRQLLFASCVVSIVKEKWEDNRYILARVRNSVGRSCGVRVQVSPWCNGTDLASSLHFFLSVNWQSTFLDLTFNFQNNFYLDFSLFLVIVCRSYVGRTVVVAYLAIMRETHIQFAMYVSSTLLASSAAHPSEAGNRVPVTSICNNQDIFEVTLTKCTRGTKGYSMTSCLAKFCISLPLT